uniref:uncharacterized protein LOC122583484 n=1 Tax=Erigeron canadensis TaxID=72917 RepID=UPI001CB8D184|nr:uncharacterized protein LOC122583484 [Erigeron canadensis]
MAASTSTNNRDVAEYLPLCKAIARGNWEEANEFFSQDPDALTAILDISEYRALHLAIERTHNLRFVQNLLDRIDPDLLPTLVDQDARNPLHYAAVVGNIDAGMMLVEKNPHLLFMYDNNDHLPIHRALFVSNAIMAQRLFEASIENIGFCDEQQGCHSPFEGSNGAVILYKAISVGFLDIACQLIEMFPELARTKYMEYDSPLWCMALNKDLYYSGTRYNFFERFVYFHVLTENHKFGNAGMVRDVENQQICIHNVLRINNLVEDKVKHNKTLKLLTRLCEEAVKTNSSDFAHQFFVATTLAAREDNPEAIEEMLNHFPVAIWSGLDDHYLIQQAVICRCEKVYNLLVHQMSNNLSLHKVLKDRAGNTVLHLAGKLAPIHKLNEVSGAALQMQRELQWFREIEKFVLPNKYHEETNIIQETPMMVFRREHKELRKEGEEWMKKTADSYTITAALIITIVFAAAITVPGGNNGDTGVAIYATKPSFIIFAVADAISLFTSTTSLLLFLSILTTRYREEDFLYKLPTRLLLGLVMLFISVTTMMIAFSATLYLMFGQGKTWIVIPIGALAFLSIATFTTLQFPLLIELISSTYGRGIFGKHNYHKVGSVTL